jgi:hypothetical protein
MRLQGYLTHNPFKKRLAHKLFQKKFDQKLLVTAWSTGATVVFDHNPFQKRLDRKRR